MGWELRNGRWYLYRASRIDGRPTKEYLGRDDDRGRVLAIRLAQFRRRAARAGRAIDALLDTHRRRLEAVLDALAGANDALGAAADGLLYAFGCYRHNRGEWRMKRAIKDLVARVATLQAEAGRPRPPARLDPPPGDAEAAEAFALARAGDPAAQARVRDLIAARGWADRLGDLGRQATAAVIRRAGGGDPVWVAAVAAKADGLLRELAGPNPTAVEELLARRVVNGWVAVHAAELEQANRGAADRRLTEHLDRMLVRAQRRMTDAARDLARVRRLAQADGFPRLVLTPPDPRTALPSNAKPDGTAAGLPDGAGGGRPEG